MPARVDDHVLPPAVHIGHRRRRCVIRERVLPQVGAGIHIECANLPVHGRADEKDSTTCGDTAAQAARRAGYSKGWAGDRGWKLLRDPEVAAIVGSYKNVNPEKMFQEIDESEILRIVRCFAEAAERAGVGPEAVWELAAECGYAADLRWSSADSTAPLGSFDIALFEDESPVTTDGDAERLGSVAGPDRPLRVY